MEERSETPEPVIMDASKAFDPGADWSEQVNNGIPIPGVVLNCIAAGIIIGLAVGLVAGVAIAVFWPGI